MIENGEISKYLTGDTDRAASYIHKARRVLGALKNSMTVGDVMQKTHTVIIDHNVEIIVSSIFGQDSISINVPKLVSAPPEPVKEAEVAEEPDEIFMTQYFGDLEVYDYYTVCEEEPLCGQTGHYKVYNVFLVPREPVIAFLIRFFRPAWEGGATGGWVGFELETPTGEIIKETLRYRFFHETEADHYYFGYETMPVALEQTPIDNWSLNFPSIDSEATVDAPVPRSWWLETDSKPICDGLYGTTREDLDVGYYNGKYEGVVRVRLAYIRPYLRSYYLDNEQDYSDLLEYGAIE